VCLIVVVVCLLRLPFGFNSDLDAMILVEAHSEEASLQRPLAYVLRFVCVLTGIGSGNA
jgi:hypothetical protein